MCPLKSGATPVAHAGWVSKTGFSLVQFFMSFDENTEMPWPVQKM